MKYKISLGDKTYEVEVEKGEAVIVDEYATPAPAAVPVAAAAPAAAPAPAPAAPAAAAAAPVADGERIVSPMPGAIVKVNVAPGDKVTKNQVLLVLEAMKMETDIPAPRDGTVAQVLVAKGASVDTDTPLVILA